MRPTLCLEERRPSGSEYLSGCLRLTSAGLRAPAQVIADGERQQKAYNSFVNWCGKSAKEKQTSIKEGASPF